MAAAESSENVNKPGAGREAERDTMMKALSHLLALKETLHEKIEKDKLLYTQLACAAEAKKQYDEKKFDMPRVTQSDCSDLDGKTREYLLRLKADVEKNPEKVDFGPLTTIAHSLHEMIRDKQARLLLLEQVMDETYEFLARDGESPMSKADWDSGCEKLTTKLELLHR
jgi:hypothetical protein